PGGSLGARTAAMMTANADESAPPIRGLVAHPDDKSVAFGLGFGQRPRDERVADAARAERRLDREQTEQELFDRADADGRKPHRSDHERADAGGERKLQSMLGALADAVGRLGEPARTEGALVQPLDGQRIVRGLR